MHLEGTHEAGLVTFYTNFFQLSNDLYGSEFLSFALPQEKSSSNYLGEKQKYDGCKMYKMDASANPLNSDVCIKENFDTNETEPCTVCWTWIEKASVRISEKTQSLF